MVNLNTFLNIVIKNADEAKHRQKKHTGHFADEDQNHELKLFVSNVSLSTKIDDDNTWFIDFGASIHMSCKRDWFDTYHEVNNGAHIYLGDNRSHEIKGYGDISVAMPNG